MLIPVGDDLKKRSLPFVGLALIAVNVLVSLYEYRLWQDGQPKRPDRYAKMVNSWQTEDPWDDTYTVDAYDVPKPFIPFEFKEFVTDWGLVPIELPDGRWERLLTDLAAAVEVTRV